MKVVKGTQYAKVIGDEENIKSYAGFWIVKLKEAQWAVAQEKYPAFLPQAAIEAHQATISTLTKKTGWQYELTYCSPAGDDGKYYGKWEMEDVFILIVKKDKFIN